MGRIAPGYPKIAFINHLTAVQHQDRISEVGGKRFAPAHLTPVIQRREAHTVQIVAR